MSYDIVDFDRSSRRLTINIRHTTPGPTGTTMETDAEMHLAPSVTDPTLRVSLLSLDLRWVKERATVPAMALELARVMEIAHWDGDKLNNALSNLRHATPVENAEDMLRHGHRVMGERHHLAVLTNEQAGELRAFDGTHSEAARAFGVRYHVAYCIRTGRTWKRAA